MMKKLTTKDLREKLQKAIGEMEKILDSTDADENKKTYAANTLKNLVKVYKEDFAVAPEEGEGGVRKVGSKDF